ADLDGQRVQLVELMWVERGGDQEDAVGAHQPGVEDVALGDGEVLAQDRQLAGRTGGLEVGGRAAEELDVGEHRQASRSPTCIRGRHYRRIEPGVEVALRGRTPLDLADHRQLLGRRQCGAEAARGRQAAALVDQLVERALVERRRLAV